MTGKTADGPFNSRIVGAGLLAGVMSVLFAVTYGTVIFAGPLAPHAGLGVNLALFSSAIVCCVLVFKASYRGTVGGVSDSAVILSVIVHTDET